MAGTNPYIEKVDAPPAKCRFKVTFKPCGTVFEVDPARIPYNRTGLPGSILDLAEGRASRSTTRAGASPPVQPAM